MPDVKAYAIGDATALAALAEDTDLMTLLPAGEYNLTLDATATVTVPALTAGSIVQVSPEIGDTLTVTGSNAPASGLAYQWQQSADGSTSWANIVGATAATLDTSSGVTDDYFVRRGVEVTGVQAMVYTAAVQVSAVSAYTPAAITFSPTSYTNALGLTEADEWNVACQFEVVDNANTFWILGRGGATSLFYNGATNEIRAIFELTTGANVALISTTTFPNAGDKASIFIKGRMLTSTTSEYELWINGSLEASSYDTLIADPAAHNIKRADHINGLSSPGLSAEDGKLIGGLIIFNSGGGGLSYSNFFNGSNTPIFESATVNSQTAIFFQNTVAGFNAGTNAGSDGNFTMNGTVS